MVTVTWAANHGILDRQTPAVAFDGTRANETLQYTLRDTIAPVVTAISPPGGSTVTALTHIDVTFSEPVGGVDAADLLINGVAATKISGSQAGPYTFEFNQPANGTVQISWAANHGIHDLALARNAFAGIGWAYTLNSNVVETAVVINEIYYHPPSENPLEEWVELFNKGATAVNLAGWHLKGAGFTFPNVSIAAGGYLVVAADVPTFTGKHPGVSNATVWQSASRSPSAVSASPPTTGPSPSLRSPRRTPSLTPTGLRGWEPRAAAGSAAPRPRSC